MRVIYKKRCIAVGSFNKSLIIIMMFITSSLTAQFAGGDGTVDNPYRIATANHLDNIRQYLGENHTYTHYILTRDIDLNVFPFNNGWTPIGLSDVVSFRGNLDGNGYKIYNLVISRQANNNIGLFGVTYNASLTNIVLVDVDIRGGSNVGSLVGRSERSSVDLCSSSGEVSGQGNYVGGLIGHNSRSTISRSYSSVNVSGINFTGGLTGRNFANAEIYYSFSTGQVNGRNTVGGIVGQNYTGNICCSYSFSRVQGGWNVGGLAGSSVNRSFITNCYSAGPVMSTSGGGLVGSASETETENSYWDTQVSGRTFSAAGYPRSSIDMVSPYTHNTYENWDFEHIWMDDRMHLMNNGYPFLRFYSSHISPNPTYAVNPLPRNNQENVPVNQDSLRWSYMSDPNFPDPLGFKLYFNDTGSFQINDEFVFTPYTTGFRDYAVSQSIVAALYYETTYYWMVVPTTINPEGRSEGKGQRAEGAVRGDAQNCPVWSFTTYDTGPNPNNAEFISPAHGENGTPLDTGKLIWSYFPLPYYALPEGFKVYLSLTGDFEEDDFSWIDYDPNLNAFEDSIRIELEYETTYYWKVVPTTIKPQGRSNSIERRVRSGVRGDAEDVPVWLFTTTPATDTDLQHLTAPELLLGNFPNPFNPETTISFSIMERSTVELSIYNAKGELINTLIKGYYRPGRYNVLWDGKDSHGREQSSGIYFHRLRLDNSEKARKMLLLK